MDMCLARVCADISHMSVPQSGVQVVTVVTVAPEGRSVLAPVAGHIHRSGGRGRCTRSRGRGRGPQLAIQLRDPILVTVAGAV